jgi:acetyl esterase/lipase
MDPTSQRIETYEYKRAGELGIEADVYAPAGPFRRGVVVWLHGGALINGNRADVPDWLREACAAHGFVLVSADYRLAPETKIPDILEDVTDLFQWMREDGRTLFDADPRRVAVVGESAGGYLTLVTGFRVDPRPVALVALYGYGDLIGEWYTSPSPHACHHQLHLTADEAARLAAGPTISDDRQRDGDGHAFYQYCRQHGRWPFEVSGWDPLRDAQRFQALMPVANVSSDFPPTLLIHGDLDTDVPIDQSERMAEELRTCGVAHRLLTLAGAEHGLAGAAEPAIHAAFAEVTSFLRRHFLETPSRERKRA